MAEFVQIITPSTQVRPPPGSVIQPEAVRAVVGEGMAAPQNMPYGNLYIKFNIVYPETLSAESCAKLKELLPPPSPVNIPDRYYCPINSHIWA